MAFKLLVATRNADKIKEIRRLLQNPDLEIISVSEIENLPYVEEDQPTLEGNAIKKATVICEASGLPTMADDTGLEVDFLNGEPGVYSSRFAGANATYDDNVAKLLSRLQGVPLEKRTARFRTVIAFCDGERIETIEGVCEGYISEERRGEGGFGYDPIFYVPEVGKTFAELSLDEKNQISHRGRALRKFKTFLQGYLADRNGA